MRTTLSWIPGHANIAGNEIADQLAKKAAKESLSLNEQYNVITMSDVKQVVKTSTKIKWQNRWTISESGRQLYDLIPMVGNASHLDVKPTDRQSFDRDENRIEQTKQIAE